ncbi:hypothetical protein MIR68_002706 [Amoeboaphelidium protococcarum]|nr:hypothetical protein MIR68_002706 [Amoeboaphelidium protococcarum]
MEKEQLKQEQEKGIPDVKNKMKRQEMYTKHKIVMNSLKKKMKERRKKAEQEDDSLRVKRLSQHKQNTIESMRRKDESMLEQADEELLAEEEQDEFSAYFGTSSPRTQQEPNILITTSPRPSKRTYAFAGKDLPSIFPKAKFVKRPSHKSHTKSGAFYTINDICKAAVDRGYNNLIVVEEDRHRKKMCGMILIHLPDGPSAYFRLSNVRLSKEIQGHGRATAHKPELIMNNFNTRLGRFVGRFFASLFPHVPQFMGRQAATFHNQRDFIFFRRHRYIFEQKAVSSSTGVQQDDTQQQEDSTPIEDRAKVRLQELGPRFTLRLDALQKGVYDLKNGEYEFLRKPDMDVDRKRFYL